MMYAPRLCAAFAVSVTHEMLFSLVSGLSELKLTKYGAWQLSLMSSSFAFLPISWALSGLILAPRTNSTSRASRPSCLVYSNEPSGVLPAEGYPAGPNLMRRGMDSAYYSIAVAAPAPGEEPQRPGVEHGYRQEHEGHPGDVESRHGLREHEVAHYGGEHRLRHAKDGCYARVQVLQGPGLEAVRDQGYHQAHAQDVKERLPAREGDLDDVRGVGDREQQDYGERGGVEHERHGGRALHVAVLGPGHEPAVARAGYRAQGHAGEVGDVREQHVRHQHASEERDQQRRSLHLRDPLAEAQEGYRHDVERRRHLQDAGHGQRDGLHGAEQGEVAADPHDAEDQEQQEHPGGGPEVPAAHHQHERPQHDGADGHPAGGYLKRREAEVVEAPGEEPGEPPEQRRRNDRYLALGAPVHVCMPRMEDGLDV